jgi:pSer/pThr/pTyr-binding forkhead associated (FHA) protein
MAELIVTLKGREIQRYGITHRQVLIGRENRNDLVLPNESVSRNHATLSYVQHRFWIQGVNAKNGVWVNQHPCYEMTPLSDGDFVQVGKYKLQFMANTGPSISVLEEESFVTQNHTQALSVMDLQSYSKVEKTPSPRSLEQIRQERIEVLEKKLSLTQLSLGMSVILNTLLLYLVWTTL